MKQAGTELDFRVLFECSPGLFLVLDPELRIVAVTDAYLRATLTRRETIVGRGLFEVFPENPHDPAAGGVGILNASLARVLRHRVEDVMPVQKYDIPRPASEGGGFEARYWSPFNSPVLAPDGSVAFIIHRVEDVTEFVRLKQCGPMQPAVTPGPADRTVQLEADIYARAHEVARVRETQEHLVAERTQELEATNRSLQESRLAALGLLDDALKARERAEHALARTQVLLGHLQLLDQITRSIGDRLDLPSIYQIVARALEDGMPLDFASICIYEPGTSHLNLRYRGTKHEHLLDATLRDESASIEVDANGLSRCIGGQLVYEPDLVQVPFPFPQGLVQSSLRSCVLAPLRSESQVFGVLIAARSEVAAFSSGDCEFLRQLSEHVALAIHQAQLYGALQRAYDDLHQTQQLAMQQERLRALGQMASGIAHDINNALSPVSLYTESLLENEPNLSAKARDYLEVIQRAVEDVAQTVARMREFYRQRETPSELVPVDLNTLASQVLELTRVRWSDMQQQQGSVIDVQTELRPGLQKIHGIESEIREALTNLIFNAIDAMPEGGTLTLRTFEAEAAGRTTVQVEIADTGAGMDEGTRQRCLEPFFTTKGERGTGLGLAMVFGMAQRHGAELQIDSTPGAGTRIRLVFSAPGHDATVAASAEPVGAPTRPLHLLLVDDDPVILKSLRDALEGDGHRISCAHGGEAGIAQFRAALTAGEDFSAVITDLGMPYVDGRRVAAAIKQASQATPVVMLTGWGQRLVTEGDIPAGVDRVLAKPPNLRDIRATLAHLCPPGVHS